MKSAPENANFAGSAAGASQNLWDWKKVGPKRRWTAFLRRKPDFLVIGAQRAGTTSLYDALCRHPKIHAAAVKETHFFTLHFERGPLWYRALFPLRGGPFLTGEATPYYLFHPLAPLRASNFVPNAKILVLLRNPIDRAFSHFQMARRAGEETLSFEEAIGAEERRLDEESAQVEAGQRSRAHQWHSYAARGRYVEQLERWFAVYSRERFWIATSEEFGANSGELTAQATRFLGLEMQNAEKTAPLNEANYAPLDPTVRGKLRDYFAPHNARLEQLLGRQFSWD